MATYENTPSSDSGENFHIFPAPLVDESFDPYSRQADMWLYRESENDSRLLRLLLDKEKHMQQGLVEHNVFRSDDKGLDALNARIAARRQELTQGP